MPRTVLGTLCVPDKLRNCKLCENVSAFSRKCLPADAIRAKTARVDKEVVIGWKENAETKVSFV